MAFSSNNDIEAALSIKRTFLNFSHRQDIESCYIIISVNCPLYDKDIRPANVLEGNCCTTL